MATAGDDSSVSSPLLHRGKTNPSSSRSPGMDVSPLTPSLPTDCFDEGVCGGDSSRERKTAWSKPANGVLEAGTVMGAVSWPALSEASKVFTKVSSHDSLKALSNGSFPGPPVPEATSPPPKSVPGNANPGSSASHAAPLRQRSMKCDVGSAAGTTNSGPVANGGTTLLKIQTTAADVSQGLVDKLMNSESYAREFSTRNSGKSDHGPRVDGSSQQTYVGNKYQRNYGGNRRDSHYGGGRGHHHNTFGNRPGQERVSYDSKNRSLGGARDLPAQQQPLQQSRPFVRPPPPASVPFVVPPPPVRPFASPMDYPDISSPFFYVPPPPESLRGMPFIAPPAMLFTPADKQVRTALLKQVEYYFSPENLCKDVYLRQNMDEEGWVPISLIASFNRVRRLTNNLPFILDIVRSSTIIEVQDEKVRRCNDWKNWPPLSPASKLPNSSTKPNFDALVAHVANVGLVEGSATMIRGMVTKSETVLIRSSSADLNGQLKVTDLSEDESTCSSVQSDSDRSLPARNLSRSDTL